MREDRTLFVGLDLCDDFSQISCFSTVTYEPESICKDRDQDKYLIPTVLAVKEDTKEWSFGEDAIACAKAGKGILLTHILEKVKKEESVNIFGTEISCNVLLEKFLKKVLSLLKIEYPNNTIRKLVITLEDRNISLINHIYEALQSLGISKVRAIIQSHEQSYVYYALSQPKELWMNDIGMFHFNEVGLSYYQISLNRKLSPIAVGITKRNFEETLSYDLLSDKTMEESVAYMFENIAKSVLHKQIISTIYVTGKGFEGNWANNTLKTLCMGRRIFMGQNLFTKGACYAAREAAGEGKLQNFLFLGEEMLTSNISTMLYHDAKMEEFQLVKAGDAWYNVSRELDLLPDGEEEIELIVYDIMKRTTVRHLITLDGVKNNPRRTIRLQLKIEFLDVHTCVVTVKDKGFGEFYQSNHRIWEKTFSI